MTSNYIYDSTCILQDLLLQIFDIIQSDSRYKIKCISITTLRVQVQRKKGH